MHGKMETEVLIDTEEVETEVMLNTEKVETEVQNEIFFDGFNLSLNRKK